MRDQRRDIAGPRPMQINLSPEAAAQQRDAEHSGATLEETYARTRLYSTLAGVATILAFPTLVLLVCACIIAIKAM